MQEFNKEYWIQKLQQENPQYEKVEHRLHYAHASDLNFESFKEQALRKAKKLGIESDIVFYTGKNFFGYDIHSAKYCVPEPDEEYKCRINDLLSDVEEEWDEYQRLKEKFE